ncbi:unnamed protein product [Owenia fusiformis]|uniref:Uncharacterized protein n=1 Tax=Owenia fusiformis TaxID=6347 RepID=A0A8S4NRN0_OWEFU|nr:unnamed protein product [Owenia fusiformis]
MREIKFTRYEIERYPVSTERGDVPVLTPSASSLELMNHNNCCNARIKRGLLILLVIVVGLFVLHCQNNIYNSSIWEPKSDFPDQMPNEANPGAQRTHRKTDIRRNMIYGYKEPQSSNHNQSTAPIKHLNINTKIANGKLLYNRIPKCGSTTLFRILQVLRSQEKRFVYSHSPIFSHKFLNLTEQEKFVKTFSRRKPPFGMDRHLYFINFEKFGFSNPIYINIVRNPLDRLVSDYYFRRIKQNKAKSRFTKDEINMTLDNCISRLGMNTCISVDRNIYTKWFCGHVSDICSNPERATALAKYNIDNIYTLIGVTEFFTETLELLEYKIPLFFKGAFNLFKTYGSRNVNKRKLDYPKTSLRIITAWLRNDLEIYYFIRQKFFNEIQKLKN